MKRYYTYAIAALFLILNLSSTVVAQEEEEENENVSERFRWFYEQRAYPHDTLKNGYLLRAYQQAKSIEKNRIFSLNAALSWTSIGPAPAGANSGRIPAIAVHPADGNTVYVGAADGGVWKSSNGGSSWTPLTDDQPTLASGCLAIDPVNPNIIYWGTGEPYSSADAYGGAGLFKSLDGGATWTIIGLTNEKRITRVAINPQNPDIVLASTWGGIYRTSNGGSSWTKTSSFSSGYDVAIDPSNPQNCYAGASGVYKSTDGGLTWTQLSNGIPTSSGRLVLAVSPSSPSTVYVLVSNTKFYKSTDAGASWSSPAIPADLFGTQGWYDIALGVSPTNPDLVFIGGIAPYYSTNGGSTWTQITGGQHPDCHAFAFGPGVIYMGNDGGITRSTNNGGTFTQVNNNLAVTQFYTLGLDNMTPANVWGGTQDNGSEKTSGSTTWTIKIVGDGGFVNIDKGNSNVVYTELQNGHHFRTTTGGNYWYDANAGISGSGAWVTPVVLHPETSAVLYTATSLIYRSSDSAKSWQPTAGSFPWGGSTVRQLAIPQTSPQTIYASPGSALYRSSDAGATWANISTGLPGRIITSIVPHRTISSRLYLTVSGSGTGHIFTSTDAGSSWTSINGNFPTDLPANSIAIDPSNDLNLYIGTDLGIWSTGDGGATWAKDMTFPNSAVVMLGVTSDNNLIAATHGRSMFKAPLSAGPFITLTSPNGGENWNIGTVHNITWAQSGVTNVKLEYSTDNGTSWATITASTSAAGGSYAWTIPNAATSQGLVRVSDASNAALNDMSNSNFTISPVPTVAVVSPNGGELWNVLSLHNITWTQTGIANVKIEYSTNGGSAWNVITAGVPAATGSYSWTVPNAPTTQGLVRVSDASNSATNDVSNGLFSIVAVPALTVTAPNGGENWVASTVHNISWTSTMVTNVKIEFSTNSGGAWLTVTGSTAASAGSYAWTVPNAPTAQGLVRLSDASNAATNDVSNAVFTIAPPPSIALTSPNGGETWNVLSSHAITWTSASIANTKIEYSTNSGSSWSLIIASTPAAAGSYAWTVPNTPTGQALVRVSDASNASLRDSSDGVFTILAAPAVNVTSPNGGEVWSVGGTQNILWSAVNILNVKIEYSTDNGSSWSTIMASVAAAAGSYSWVIPNTPSTHSRVRISDAGNVSTNDISDATFSIAAPTGITVTSPNGGEIWNASTVHAITWISSGVNNIKIKYSANNGSTWNTIVSSTPSSAGSYSWTVPNAPTAQALIQISNSNGTITDASDGIFTISSGPAITVTAPNGGENWEVGTTQSITWTASGFANVNIEYSTDAGSTWSPVVSNVQASLGTYAWTIPNTVTAQALVRTSDASNASTNDVSNGVFGIVLPLVITLTAPNGGETFMAGSTTTISWSSVSIDNVRIEYSTDNGGNWILIASSVPAVPSNFSWVVPNVQTASGLVRVSEAAKFIPSDQSDNPFSIASIQFLAQLICTDNGSQRDTLFFGAGGGATDGIDSLFGEHELSPKPSLGTFDVRWAIGGTQGIKKDIRDTLSSLHTQAIYTCELQAGGGGYPFTLAWGALAKGVWTLRDGATHGTVFKTRMRSNRSYTLNNPSITSVEVVHDIGKTQTTTVASAWNMLSVPLKVSDNQTQSLFPGAVSQAYSYTESGYKTEDSLVDGVGYWLKFSTDQTYDITGEAVLDDTIDVGSGWNLIGSVSDPVGFSSIASTPPGILTPVLFGFTGGVYTISDSIMPMKAYWIKTTQAGQVILSSTQLMNSVKLNNDRLLKQLQLSSITITDRDGVGQRLYVGERAARTPDISAAFELPPLPPEGMFDVRFGSQRLVELFESVPDLHMEYPIDIQSDAYPLTVHWEMKAGSGVQYTLTDREEGRYIGNYDLQGNGDARIGNPHVTSLLLKIDVHDRLPETFALWQNYPNPFNPVTTIRFDLPVAAEVSLKVYNILGKEVATLINGFAERGTHVVEWSGDKFPSGLYYYKFVAGNFAETRKMLLLK